MCAPFCVREPAEDRRNKVGCYGLIIMIALIAGLLATLGLSRRKRNELSIAISSER